LMRKYTTQVKQLFYKIRAGYMREYVFSSHKILVDYVLESSSNDRH